MKWLTVISLVALILASIALGASIASGFGILLLNERLDKIEESLG